MPKKFTKEDVESWSVQEVQSWLHSKKLTHCLPDFQSAMTNDDLKALPSVSGNEKKRKVLKKALSQLPGNSVSGKTTKSKGAGNKAKEPPPVQSFPPSSFEPVPALPPGPFPPSSASTFHPPQSPNSATYSDPSLIWGEEDLPQDIYDNPNDAMEEAQAPPLPPHPSYHHHQQQDGGYGEEEDQVIYDQYEEEEEEMFDSSFASEEEEEEEEGSALNGVRNANPGTKAEANIRAISARFFVEGLREHTGILTASTPPSMPRGLSQPEEESEEDIYDLPPEELQQHLQGHPVVLPPDLPPSADRDEEEGIMEDIYDTAEEVLQTVTGVPAGRALPPCPQPPPPLMEDIYETAAPEEEEEDLPPPLPPTSYLPPPSSQDTLVEVPPRPPKPGSSPGLPRKAPPLSPGPSRPQMREPIRGGPPPGMRPPIQSTSVARPSLSSTSHPSFQPSLPPKSESTGPPAPPPPPSLTSQTSGSSGSSSPRPWSQRKDPPSSSSSSNSPFSGGRRFPAHPEPHPPASENKFLKPSEMKGNSRSGGLPAPGKFVGRAGLKPVAGKTVAEKRDMPSKPAISDKPMSILERIKLLSKPAAEEGEVKQQPAKPAEGLSPCTGRKMTRDNSVSDLIKSYHSGGSSEGERSRPMSPETKPSLPAKPAAASHKHINNERSPHLKRRPIGQQGDPAPSLPDKQSAPPSWKKALSEDQESGKKPPWQRERPGPKPWQKKADSEDAQDRQPPWRKAAEEPSQPPWRKAAEEPSQPPWRKAAEEPSQPPWRKAAEEPSQPPWRKAAEEPSQPPWRKAAEEPIQPPWRKAAEEPSQPPWKRPPAEAPPPEPSPSPGVSRQSFTYKPYKSSRPTGKPDSAPNLPPPRQKEDAPPPNLPPLRKKEDAPPPNLPPPRQKEDAPPPNLPPPRRKEDAPPPEPPRPRFTAPDNSPPELPGRPRTENPPPPEPPRPSLPPDRPRFRGVAQDGPAPPEPPWQRPPIREDPPPEVPKMSFSKSRGRPLPQPEGGEQPLLPPRPLKLPERPTVGSEPGPNLPLRPWQRPPAAVEPVKMPPRPPKSQAPEAGQSSGSPAGHSWYHANLKDRKVAESRLLQHPRDGTFIIRDSSRSPGEYSLSLLYQGAVKHLRIRLRGDGKYVLGEEKADEVAFGSVVELVNHHKREPLVLKSGGKIILRYECPH